MYVLKVSSDISLYEVVCKEIYAFIQLNHREPFEGIYPEPIKLKNGEYVGILEDEHGKKAVRMATFIHGNTS